MVVLTLGLRDLIRRADTSAWFKKNVAVSPSAPYPKNSIPLVQR